MKAKTNDGILIKLCQYNKNQPPHEGSDVSSQNVGYKKRIVHPVYSSIISQMLA